MLVTLLRNVITDEDVSIIECDNLYKRFGFKCNPIMFGIGQECVKAIFEQVKYTKEYFEISDSVTIKNKRKLEIPYCKLDIKGLLYYYEGMNSNGEKSISKDIDNAILLINEKINEKRKALQKKDKLIKSNSNTVKYNEIVRLNYDINEYITSKKLLLDLKSQKKYATLESRKKALIALLKIYSKFNVKYNVRNILPLENMSTNNSNQVYLVTVPSASIPNERYGNIHTFGMGFGNISEDIIYNAKPLWQKYEREFNELGIRVHLVNPNNFDTNARFKIYVNLNDILELPIDLKKVKLITNEELKELMERKVKEKNTSTNINTR